MYLSPVDLQKLKTEITTDPPSHGYVVLYVDSGDVELTKTI